MILWDIAVKYTDVPGPMWAMPTFVGKVPNGNNLPEDGVSYHWERNEVAISGDEAQHLLSTKYSTITQAKC